MGKTQFWCLRFFCAVFWLFAFANSGRAQDVDYKVRIDGAADNGLRSQLEAVSKLKSADPRTAYSLGALRRRADNDAEGLARALQSYGYYAGTVRASIRADEDPALVVFSVDTGDLFQVSSYKIVYADQRRDDRPTTLDDLGVQWSGSSAGSDIQTTQNGVLRALRNGGYPSARLAKRDILAKFDRGTAEVVLQIESGPLAVYGPVEWSGLERTKQDHVEALILWREGEPVNLGALEGLRNGLAGTGLFGAIDVAPAPTEESGRTPILVDVEERAYRSIGTGLSYSTNTGFGAEVFWENRNLWGRAERLRADLAVSEILRSGQLSIQKPQIRTRTTYFGDVELAQDDTDAFDSSRVSVSAGLSRSFGKKWRARAAAEIEASDIDDALDDNRQSLILSLPLRVERTTVDDPLNPTKGSRLALEVSPQGGVSDGAVLFTVVEGSGSVYRALTKDDRFVVAARSRVGFIAGPGTSELPANRRFFAGGAGSLRAYGYQLVGPLEDVDQPIGGRYVAELGAELRTRFKENFGAVIFVEAASVSASGFSDIAEEALYGAGVGLRYYSPVGPLRLDLAVPLDRRDGVDDAFQIYVSIGQAF